MDPISITCTVGAITRTVFSISWTLTRFIKDTKGVNQSVKDLAVEVSNLIGALKAVQTGLNDPAIRNAEAKADKAESLELWRSVNGSLLNTRATVDRLDEALEDIRENKTNFAKQAVRQFKLNLKQDEINAIRAQFRTHISALQMTLLMMSVRATCMTSEITAELGPKIEKLGGMIEELKQDIQTSRTLNDVDHVPQLISAKHAERLNKTAQKILSSASTMYSQSEWGGSVFGEVLDDFTRQRMQEWIPPAPLAEESVSQTTLSEQFSPRSGDSIFSEAEKKSTLSTDPTEMLSLVEEDDDTAGEFDFEVVEKFLQQAAKAAAQEDYESASTFIQAGHAQSETLTLEQRHKLDLRSSQLLLAKCSYFTGNLDSAEMQLITYADRYPPTPVDSTALQACEASHLLSQVYLRKNKAATAHVHCRKAMIGRRRILGKEHVTYFESLFLLAEICEVSNAKKEAEVYLDMIPDEIKSTFTKVAVPPNGVSPETPSQPILKIVPPQSNHALHSSVLFDFDSLDPQPEYVPGTTNFAPSPTQGDLERNFSSNNPFRRHLSNKAAAAQRTHSNANPDSRPHLTQPETPIQLPQRTMTTGGIPSTPMRSNSSSAKSVVTEIREVPAVEGPDHVDWSLLWRFVAKVDISLLPPEILRGTSKPNAPTPKFITSSMLKKASVESLQKLALSLAAPATSVISPLHLAVCINHTELAMHFLEKEFYDVNQKCHFFASDEPVNRPGNTPMHCAAQFGRVDMMRVLFEAGADVSIKNQSGYTPLHTAVIFGQLEAVTQLYDPDTFIAISGEKTPLHLAAKHKRTPIMQALLESWPDLEVEDADGFTALHIAAQVNAVDCVEELLQRGADPEALDSRTWTALHLATEKGHVRTVQILLTYNALVDAKTNKGETALHLSVRHRQVLVFRKLLGYGAHVDAQNWEGLTALHLAVEDRQRGTIDTLIQRGASLEMQEVGTQKRPLHMAVLKGKADVVRMLIQAGAQTDVVDANGRSPMDIAETLRYSEIIEALRQVSEAPQRQAVKEPAAEDSDKIALAPNQQEAPASYIPTPYQPNAATYESSAYRPSAPSFDEQPGLEVSFAEQVSWPYHHRSDWATAPDWTPLHRAAYLGQKDLVMSLINQGASISKQTRDGYTPRGLAAIQNNVAIEAFLEGLEMRGPSIRSKFSRLFVRDDAK